MRFEVIEYRDENGQEKIVTTYEIAAADYQRTLDALHDAMKAGRISGYAITQV